MCGRRIAARARFAISRALLANPNYSMNVQSIFIYLFSSEFIYFDITFAAPAVMIFDLKYSCGLSHKKIINVSSRACDATGITADSGECRRRALLRWSRNFKFAKMRLHYAVDAAADAAYDFRRAAHAASLPSARVIAPLNSPHARF